MIVFSEIAIGTGGEVGCVLCARGTSQATPRSLADVAADLDATATAWSDGPGPNVAFVGFEPFRHPELPPLIAAAATRGFERIRLRTDGGALAQAGNAAGAYAAGVRHLELLVLGDKEAHDRLTGRPELFEAACAGAAAFTATGAQLSPVLVTGRVPLCKHNIARAPAAVAELGRMGAIAVVLDCAALKPSDANAALVDAALDTGTVNRVAVHAEAWSLNVPDAHRRAPSSVLGRHP